MPDIRDCQIYNGPVSGLHDVTRQIPNWQSDWFTHFLSVLTQCDKDITQKTLDPLFGKHRLGSGVALLRERLYMQQHVYIGVPLVSQETTLTSMLD